MRRVNQPRVCIIAVNWNGLRDTIECLESLKKITYPNYEVIVVDNGSRGNDVQVLEEKFGGYIHLIKNDRNYGYCVANNMAIRYALDNSNPDYLLLLNNDTVVAPEFLTEMVKVAESDPAIGLASPKFYYYDEPNRLQFIGGEIGPWAWDITGLTRGVTRIIGRKEFDKGQHDSIREIDSYAGWCALIRRKSLESIGLLDERYFMGWEDVDYSIRTGEAGYKIVYVPRAKVWHKYRSAGTIDGHLQYHGTKNRFRLMKEHATKWQYRYFLIYFFGIHLWLATAYYLIYHRRPKVLLSFCKGVRDGLFLPWEHG